MSITVLFLGLASCNEQPHPIENNFPKTNIDTLSSVVDSLDLVANEKITETKDSNCSLKDSLEAVGLINVQRFNQAIKVDLKYSTLENFMGIDMYGCLDSLYLQKEVAEKLIIAQAALSALDSTLVLLVYDGTRPQSVQQMMWDSLDLPFNEKVKFVSNPRNGSLHNYGAAVDLTIYDLQNNEIMDMGTPYDFIGVEAWPTQEMVMLSKGILSQDQIDHRKLLRKVMRQGGFFNIQTEWWHFNACTRAQAKVKYSLVK